MSRIIYRVELLATVKLHTYYQKLGVILQISKYGRKSELKNVTEIYC